MLEKTLRTKCLIIEAWDLANNFVSLGSRTTSLRQYIQVDLEKDEEFYKGVVSTFVMEFLSMSDYKRKEKDFPSSVRIK